jgi:hypothetical protein
VELPGDPVHQHEPATRLADTWNAFAGRNARVAVQRLSPEVAQPAETVAPAKENAKKPLIKLLYRCNHFIVY